MEIPVELAESLGHLSAPDQAMIHAVARGKDFEALFAHTVYRRILDWFEVQVNASLHRMRESQCIDSDRIKANLQLKWATQEELLHEFQIMVQDAIDEKERVLKLIQENQ